MDLKDPRAKISGIASTHYSASGQTMGVRIKTANGEVNPLVLSESDVRQLVELLLSLAKEAARAPEAKAADMRTWSGKTLEVDAVSLLDASTTTHALLGLSFGRVTLGISVPKLMLGKLLADASGPLSLTPQSSRPS